LFVAAWPPAGVVERLGRLPRADVPGVRWTRPDQWHVTLRFLGEADEVQATQALRRLRAAPAEAVLGPRPDRLGRAVLVVPVRGLEALAAAVAVATASVTAPSGTPPARGHDQPFLGHLTLARLRGRPACALTAPVVRDCWWVDEVALVASEPGPAGSVYRTVVTVALDGGDGGGGENHPATSSTT
jgi:2'-5' RNA ligase